MRFVCVIRRENEYVYSSLWLIHYSIAAVNANMISAPIVLLVH